MGKRLALINAFRWPASPGVPNNWTLIWAAATFGLKLPFVCAGGRMAAWLPTSPVCCWYKRPSDEIGSNVPVKHLPMLDLDTDETFAVPRYCWKFPL